MSCGPLWSESAEAGALGAALIFGRDAFDDLRQHCEVDHFHAPRHQAVFRAMQIVTERGDPLDVITIEAQLRRTGELELVGGIEGIARLDKHTGRNAGHYAQIIRDFADRRTMITAAREITEDLHDLDVPNAEQIQRCNAKWEAALEGQAGGGYQTMAQVLSATVSDAVARAKGERPLVTSGFEPLDRELVGYEPGQLVYLAGRPGMGKTAVLVNSGIAQARQGVPVLYLNLEIANVSLARRMISGTGRLRGTALRRPSTNEVAELIRAAQRIQHLPIAMADTAYSIGEILATIRRWTRDRTYFPRGRATHGIVKLDYLQLASDPRERKSREREVAAISRALKVAAKDWGLTIEAAAQLNRGPEHRDDHRPQVADLRESGSIEQDADVVLLLYRPWAYDHKADPRHLQIGIGKHRDGPSAEWIDLHFDVDTGGISEDGPLRYGN